MIGVRTLRWPTSLKKDVQELEKARIRNINWLKGLGIITTITGMMMWVTKTDLWLAVILVGIYMLYKWFIILLEPSTKEQLLHIGSAGEMEVAHMLNTLPEGWYIINDFIVNENQIDHLVLGPRGVFCIETKNWNTAATDRYGNWYRYRHRKWHLLEENPAKQNMSHIFALKKFIQEKCNIRLHIGSIVVLSNPKGAFEIIPGNIYPGGTVICAVSDLRKMLLNWQGNFAKKKTRKIIDAVMTEVQKQAV